MEYSKQAYAFYPQHIIVRGNNRQVCFTNEDDMAFYISCLKDYLKKHQLQIHVWVLMTHHIHLLCTPLMQNAVSKTIQDIGRLYACYFNKTYRRRTTNQGRLLVNEDYNAD